MNSPAEVPVLLLVDDEPAILSALRRLLRPEGYTLHLAESGHAGLELLEREKVDLVISDMRMPEMDGAQFLEQVRLRWPDITRLLLTGYADISSTIDAINRGEIYRYISKPWVDSDLMLIIRGALESARLRNENQRLLELTQRQNAELTELNASLEDKVKQRTQEIEQINDFLNLANEQLKQNFLTSIKVFSNLMEAARGLNRSVSQVGTSTASGQGPELTHLIPPLVWGRCLRWGSPVRGVVASGSGLRVSTIGNGADDEPTQGRDEAEGVGLPGC